MKTQLLFLVLSLALTLAQTAKPIVELYYETLCPYSRAFFIDQLEPTFQTLANYIDVEVIPYGNVKVEEGPGGLPLFTCQHGAAECYGNRVQACVIEYVSNATALSLEYVRCMFAPDTWKDTYTNAEACVAAQFGAQIWPAINGCHGGQQGLDLIVRNWKRTDALVPAHTYVPWIVIDGVHTEELQDAAQGSLLPYLCANQLAGQDIPECSAAKLVKVASRKNAVTFA